MIPVSTLLCQYLDRIPLNDYLKWQPVRTQLPHPHILREKKQRLSYYHIVNLQTPRVTKPLVPHIFYVDGSHDGHSDDRDAVIVRW